MGSVSLQQFSIFRDVGISEVHIWHLLRQMSPQWGSQKLLQGSVLHKLIACLSEYYLFFTQWIVHFKGTQTRQLKRNFTNIRGLRWMWIFSWMRLSSFLNLPLCETNLIDSDNLSVKLLSSSNPKGFCYSYAWSCSLYEGGTSFCSGIISRKLRGFFFLFSTDCISFTDLTFTVLFVLIGTVFVIIWEIFHRRISSN